MNARQSVVAATLLALASGAWAASHGGQVDHVAQHGGPTMTEGEVRKVDMDTKKITLKHGEIKNLDMPSMTMVFQVKDPALLKKVKAGDKVKFSAEKIDGAFTVTAIEAAK